jgi:hypothetical protein
LRWRRGLPSLPPPPPARSLCLCVCGLLAVLLRGAARVAAEEWPAGVCARLERARGEGVWVKAPAKVAATARHRQAQQGTVGNNRFNTYP